MAVIPQGVSMVTAYALDDAMRDGLALECVYRTVFDALVGQAMTLYENACYRASGKETQRRDALYGVEHLDQAVIDRIFLRTFNEQAHKAILRAESSGPILSEPTSISCPVNGSQPHVAVCFSRMWIHAGFISGTGYHIGFTVKSASVFPVHPYERGEVLDAHS